MENDKKFSGSLDQLVNRVIVKHDGQVAWLTPALLIAKCSMNIKYFPFDEQICRLDFGSWTYVGESIDLDAVSDKIALSKFKAFVFPAGTQRQDDVVWTLKRHQNVKTTSIQHRSDVVCRLG